MSNLVQLASHTVDLDLLPESPFVLDVGCRGFDFTREVLKHRQDARVIAMDPDPIITEHPSPDSNITYLGMALVGDERTSSLYAGWSTGEGNFICDQVPHYAERFHTVLCINIRTLMAWAKVDHFDLVKLDCEGSEFNILEHWPGPVATQINVEFHDWTGPWKQHVAGAYYPNLWARPLKDYEVVQHETSRQGEGVGHWDTLLRLRK